MTISFEEALKAQKDIEDTLLKDPNVVSVGVVEELNRLGQKTGNFAIKVGVISAEVYQNALDHGESIIPSEYKIYSSNGSHRIKHVKINVIKTGEINALYSFAKRYDLPDALDNIPPASMQTSDDHKSRQRPSLCGQSVGHPTITAGTIGLLTEYVSGPQVGRAYILSNNHVLAANNAGFVGDAIIQPGTSDSGKVGSDTIASLHRWVPIDPKAVNYVDAAIAEVMGEQSWNKYLSPHVSKIGSPGELGDAELGMSVEKTGRTTGYTQGQIISINQTVKVNYGKLGIILFKDQICTTSMSQGGDSGSCLFERGTKKPVGLLFAGHESESFHNPIKAVLSSLSLPAINKYPSGKTHTFAKDHSLRILRRTYSTSTSQLFNFNSYKLLKTQITFNPLVKRACLVTSFGIFGTIRLVSFLKQPQTPSSNSQIGYRRK
jgi:hypothetical protein